MNKKTNIMNSFAPITQTEKKYLSDMIEHHQMAVVMAKDILKVTEDSDIMSVSYAILLAQINEISLMKEMLRQRPVA